MMNDLEIIERLTRICECGRLVYDDGCEPDKVNLDYCSQCDPIMA